MPSLVSHLEAAIDATRLPARTLQTVHNGRPIWVRYDLDAVRRALSRDDLARRPQTMWRYRELLPCENESRIVSLGETVTPLIDCPALARRLGVRRLIVKDESRLPTGSFKSRGMAMAVTLARELGVTRVAAPTAGNAGGALAAYAARAGLPCWVFMPDDTPLVNRLEVAAHGAHAFLVNGLIHECGKIVADSKNRIGWFDMSTLKEPYRLEGKKTMGLELAEQLGWKLPDVILYPTGGGTGLIGMWKAFAELTTLGWLENDRKPRMFACQSSGCDPIVAAFDKGERFGIEPANPHTIASGLRVPRAVGDFMILDAVRASGGRAMAADEARITDWVRVAGASEGLALCPESAACLDVLERALCEGHIGAGETVVLYNTGAATKYVEALATDLPRIDKANVDWDRLGAGAHAARG